MARPLPPPGPGASGPGTSGAGAGTPGARDTVIVWDLPLRLFHWSLVLLFLAAWWTGSRESLFGLHEACGIALAGLLVFRLVWGFTGNRAARFASFLGGPRAVAAHLGDLLRGRLHPEPGHNPLGGWAVAVMLLLLLTEVVSGLFSTTFDYEGPLARLLPDAWTDTMAAVHAVNLDLLWGMIGLHLLGVAVTSILGRENLVGAMITGRKRLAAGDHGAGQGVERLEPR